VKGLIDKKIIESFLGKEIWFITTEFRCEHGIVKEIYESCFLLGSDKYGDAYISFDRISKLKRQSESYTPYQIKRRISTR
jgi:hypothetical protein